MKDYKVIAGESDISIVEEYFGNGKQSFPWEWFFIFCLQNVELNIEGIAYKFIIFVKEYYPHFKWIEFDSSSWLNTVKTEAKFCGMAFSNMTEHHSPNSIALPHAREFGSIVREFLVRYRSYTFINKKDKTIFTAINGAESSFSGYLAEGYRIQQIDKVTWIELTDGELLKGVFSPAPKEQIYRTVESNNATIENSQQDINEDFENLVIPGSGVCRS